MPDKQTSARTLSEFQMQLVCENTEKWIRLAESHYGKKLATIPVQFNLRGRIAGMFCFRNDKCFIRYNEAIFARHFEESLSQTIPHEVAHYVVFKCFKRRTKPHGQEWKSVMQMFGIPADVTCRLDISELPQRRLTRHLYKCECSTHKLTSIRHNRIKNKGARYACPKCKKELTYTV